MKTVLTTSLLLVVFVSLGCDRGGSKELEPPQADPTPPRWDVVDAEDLSPQERAQLTHAEQSRGVMGQRLMGEVNRAAAEAGYAHAIDVCREEAGPIAAEVAEQRKIAIGRTSSRLRNPENLPPVWARNHVASDTREQLVVRDHDGTVGTAVPIFLAAPCANCHGTEKQLADGVAEALSESYPEDRATGFRKGELRGWFWVEAGPEAVDDAAVERFAQAAARSGQSDNESLSEGEKLYQESCAACHGSDGAGVPGVFPPLRQTERVTGAPAALIAISLDGMTGPLEVHGESYDGFMPGQAQLDDEQMATLLTHLRGAWGNDASPIDAAAVEAVREHTLTRTAAWTDGELDALNEEFEE